MSNTIWPKPEMHSEMQAEGRAISACRPMPSDHYMNEELDKYDHLTRTEDKPMRLHLCGNGITSGHNCANPDHIKIGTHKENMNMPDAIAARKGRTHSDEAKQKISKAKKGKPSPMKGKPSPLKGRTWKLIDGKRVWMDK